MFGFLRPACSDREYRQIYAAYCSFQRKRYGVLAAGFVSYEAVFMYLLAVELGACLPPASSTPTCCKLRLDPRNDWRIDVELADFCAAVAMVLAGVKLDDDVRDSQGVFYGSIARSLRAALRSRVQIARRYLDSLQSGICEQLTRLVDEHVAMERTNSTVSLDQYAASTGAAFALVFSQLGYLCGRRLGRSIELASIGNALGKGILISDCVADHSRDRRRGEFNPLRDRGDVSTARQLGLDYFSEAGWSCWNMLGGESKAVKIVRSSFDRVAKRRDNFQHRKALASASRRRGICDCDCDCGPCDGGDCGSADNCCGNSCDCCDMCTCYDPCWQSSHSRKTSQGKAAHISSQGNDLIPFIGLHGTVVSPLNPTGIVRIEGRDVPARSDAGWIDAQADVTVVDANAFGVTVRAVNRRDPV